MDTSAIQASPRTAHTTNRKPAEEQGLFGDDGFSFDDFLDVINPFQHIPVVSTIYREITGDEISTGARMAGGAVFGGPIGFIASVVNSAIESLSGKDVGEHVVAMFSPEEGVDSVQPVHVASSRQNPFNIDIPAQNTAKAPDSNYEVLIREQVEQIEAEKEDNLKQSIAYELNSIVPPGQIPTVMMHALDKYQQMAIQRYYDPAAALPKTRSN